MPKPLTELESRILDYLFEYLRRNTYQPSIREIGSQFAIKSTKTVSELLQSMADKGWIERDPSRSRGVRLLGMETAAEAVAVPLLDENGTEASVDLLLDRSLAGNHGTFLVPMQGDHLVEEGIRAGDLLLVTPISVERLQTGDLAAARMGGRISVRRCVREAGAVVLEPTDGEHLSTTLTTRQASSAINGVVTGVVRRLRTVLDHAPGTLVPPA